ncbi:hypothetical protein F895_00468 [Acinetobacter sp. CIP 64.2]|uniref:hypothetical protein n=1 Tax=Acinetobacter TaxID=469 RepID=UPI000287E75F|nr:MULTISPECIES: hypothetical protein [Acinetobacter]ENX17976.1 hypothetical protein F895_00468 [Acinetobacter sp. CIP 64.2]UUM28627.1 hypothetical protein NQU59_05885 [Acinetobacter colistiniresistens]
MRLVISSVLLCLGMTCLHAAPLLSASIMRETQTIGNDGVTRTSVFQERMYRNTQNIWIERVLPKHHQHGQEKGGHKHLDLAEAAQHYFIDHKKQPKLNLVLMEDKTVVHLQDADVDMLGLSNCWSCVYSLIDPKSLKAMTVKKKDANTTWYETQNKKNKMSIEWDNRNNIAKRVEVRSLDGLRYDILKANIQQVNIAEPWKTYSKFTTKDYSDFGD